MGFIGRFILIALLLCAGVAKPISVAEAAQDKKKPVMIAVGYDKPPYIFNNGNSGYFIDLIRASFVSQGVSVDFMYMPTRRMLRFGTMSGVDAIGGAPISNPNNCRSIPFMRFENVVIYDSQEKAITSLTDIEDKSVVAFQNAALLLGADFRSVIKNNRAYTEVDSQKVQVRSFLKGRFDVAIMDRNIFAFWAKHIENTEGITRGYKMATLFEWKTSMGLEFKNKNLCDRFNKGLGALIKSGEAEKLKAQYLKADH